MTTGTLVLLRHGESEWNKANLFTGWVDVPLSETGRAEAARLISREAVTRRTGHEAVHLGARGGRGLGFVRTAGRGAGRGTPAWPG